jgi:RNA-directed DNA polymerase
VIVLEKDAYRIWQIPKRDGTKRTIAEPCPELKARQKAILRWLQARGLRASPYAHGFVRKRSTATHARLHVGKRVVIKLDLVDFFGSTTKEMVYKALRQGGVDHDTAASIAQTCTLNGALPQGAPTSPFLSNLVLRDLDFRMAGLAGKGSHRWPVAYSRYADDLVCSSNDPKLNHLLPAICYVVGQAGYEVNRRKTRVLRRNLRQIVTGVVVNRKVNLPRDLRRTLRARLHNLKCSVLNGGVLDGKGLASASGMVSYARSVRAEVGVRFGQDLREIGRLRRMAACS